MQEALNIQQRLKRANIAHRNKSRLERARIIASRKLAPESNIKKRAYALARKILRKKIAGGRGAEYQSLGPTEKEAIDKQLDSRKSLIKKIAKRLMPKVKQAEQHRLQSFLKGAAMKNIDEAFEKKFADKKKKKKGETGFIKILDKFTEEAESSSKAYRSLVAKSAKYNVDIENIAEVYNSAFIDYDETLAECSTISAQQFAFNRVNHYLAELSKATLGRYVKAAGEDRVRIGVKMRSDDLEQKFSAGFENSKRRKGADLAVKRLTKEETLDELSKDTYNSYINASYKARNKEFLATANRAYTKKREKGIQRADRLLSKKVNEETLDEISKSTLKSYLKKKKSSGKDYRTPLAFRKSMESNDIAASKIGKPGRKVRGTNARLERTPVKIKATNEETLDEGRFIVSGVHQDQGHPKTQIYKADSADHAKSLFNSDHGDNYNVRKVKKIGFGDHLKEEHDKCGTPECCGQCQPEPVNELLVTATLLAIKNRKKIADGIKNQSPVVKKVGSFLDKKPVEDKPEQEQTFNKMSSKEYLKKRAEMMKNEELGPENQIGTPALTRKLKKATPGQVDKIDEAVKHTYHIEGKGGTPSLGVAHPGHRPPTHFNVVVTDKNDKTIETHGPHYSVEAAHYHAISKGHEPSNPNVKEHKSYKLAHFKYHDDKNGGDVQKNVKRSEWMDEAVDTQKEKIEKLNARTRRQKTSNERKLNPFKKKLDEATQPLLHYGVVMLHRANKEHKVIKFSEPHPTSLQNQTTGKWNYPHSNAIHKDIHSNAKVKEHKAGGWEVDYGVVSHQKMNVLQSIKGHLDGHAFRKFTLKEEIDLDEDCWKGYKQLGMKRKGKKIVPNCVKEDVKSAEEKGVIVPSYIDAFGNTIPAKVVKRKVGNKILSTEDPHDGK